MSGHKHDDSDVYVAALHFASGGVSHFLVMAGRKEMPEKQGYFYLTDIKGKKLPWENIQQSAAFKALPELKQKAVQLAYDGLDEQTSAHGPVRKDKPRHLGRAGMILE